MPKAGQTDRSILNAETLRHLFRQLEATDVDELELVVGASRIYLRREPGRRAVVERPPDNVVDRGVAVVAPLTGVFFSRPAPDQPPFVEVGARIVRGQLVALIETMKLFNEVTTEVAGEILSVAVSDGDLVETGQPLMYIRLDEDGEEP